LNRDFRDKSVFLQDRRMRPATGSVVNNADAAPLDRNAQPRKTIHAAPLLLNRESAAATLSRLAYRRRPPQRSGSLAKFAAIRRASFRVNRIGRQAVRRRRYLRNRGISGSARLALETTLMTLSGSGIGTRRWATSASELTSELPSEFIDERS